MYDLSLTFDRSLLICHFLSVTFSDFFLLLSSLHLTPSDMMDIIYLFFKIYFVVPSLRYEFQEGRHFSVLFIDLSLVSIIGLTKYI